MLSCFRLPRPAAGDTDQAAASPRRPSLPFATSLFAASPSTSGRGKSPWPSEADDMEKKRWDSMESWSMLLDTAMGPAGEGSRDSGRREEWMADLSQLFIGNKFASGANSRIYRGIYKQRAVAVKMVRIPERDEARRAVLEDQFNSEVAFLSRLYHPNIVQFIAACKKPPVYCIITEYMSQGTLRMYLNKKDPYSLSPETILKLALDISRGMEYLHAQGVIHRDLKSQNLLLNDEMRVKVADFGTSCLETRCQATKGNKGTYRWMAPEMTKEKPYTRKVDVYSFGIVLWELTTCLLPFQGMTPVQAAYAASEKNLRPPLSSSCPPVLNNLIKRCWSANPARRPEFSYIVSVLEKYDHCVKEGMPVMVHQELRIWRSFAKIFRVGCVTNNLSIPVHA
ncbi:serine/threonine/tyrosine-protein kinase HT1-like isoform X1 [Phragmites australis]|uniref:serine/threonine/tyrosine-protein kinase HT1-like isoform X1 n=1 Tax=Phragmites australis TaxID=29695 RepID=UPI002D79C929|nr:serine/threonine/tyrosine-protein kinase HT1-like isoform X1 [Phragmites australis]